MTNHDHINGGRHWEFWFFKQLARYVLFKCQYSVRISIFNFAINFHISTSKSMYHLRCDGASRSDMKDQERVIMPNG